ncbi:MAG: sigma-70 family RNA polymerase sigma factor [Lachnospiraceae bacterium]|nr:sigma-70 family RNA polymerase sigma factor [Lachnospiraceae bacterium]
MTNEELVTRIKAGIDISENMLQLYEQIKPFIHVIAKRYHGWAEVEDLEQEGYLALYDAIAGFDAEKGYKFLTYAGYWIKRHISRYVDGCHAVRVPANKRKMLQEYKRVLNALSIALGRKPVRREIAANMRLTVEQVEDIEVLMLFEQIASLDAPLVEDGDRKTLGDMLPCAGEVERDVIEDIQQGELAAILWPLVDALPDTEGYILRRRYQREQTYASIGHDMGIDRYKARRIEYKALRKLRYSRESRRLRSFLPEHAEVYDRAIVGNGVERFNTTWESSTERVAMWEISQSEK